MSEPAKGYERTLIYQTDAFELVSIDWKKNSVSPLHDHAFRHCAVLIKEGTFENRLDLGIKQETQTFSSGHIISTPRGAKHEIRCTSAYGRTLHIYTPRLAEHEEPKRFSTSIPADLSEQLSLSRPVDMLKLTQLMQTLKRHSISTHSPYFMNQLFSGVMPQMLLAEELAAITKTTLATHEASPVFSKIEIEVVDSLCALIGWKPGTFGGVCVPGGSAANFMALHCARYLHNPEIKSTGMSGRPFKIFVSTEAHYSFQKACAVLGIGTDHIVRVPTDEKGRMRPEALQTLMIEHQTEGAIPLAVVATAGTTVLGAFDDIVHLKEVCQTHRVWLHVDAAWGGPAMFSKLMRHLVRGIELADSVTFDAHKLLGAGLTSSFFLTQHPQVLQQANDVTGADYLFHAGNSEPLDLGKLAWQCGRRADALSFWAIWKNVGTEGLGAFVDRLASVRDEMVDWIQTQDRLELVSHPDYLNICVRIHPPGGRRDPDWARELRERLKEKNMALVNYSTDSQGSFLRLILAHPFLKTSHVRQVLDWALAEA